MEGRERPVFSNGLEEEEEEEGSHSREELPSQAANSSLFAQQLLHKCGEQKLEVIFPRLGGISADI